jgi:transposase
MSVQRKRRSAQFKFQVALAAINDTRTINQLASKHGVHPSQISQWKRQLMDEGPTLFSSCDSKKRCRPNYTNRLGDSRWNWSG